MGPGFSMKIHASSMHLQHWASMWVYLCRTTNIVNTNASHDDLCLACRISQALKHDTVAVLDCNCTAPALELLSGPVAS